MKEQADVGAEITKKRRKRRTLNQSERIIYAPSCNLGTLNFDYSSGYVTIPHDYVKFTKVEDAVSSADTDVPFDRNLPQTTVITVIDCIEK